MAKLFNRTDGDTMRRSFGYLFAEALKDKRRFITYSILIPLNRLIMLVILPLFFSLIIQALIADPGNWQHPIQLLGYAVIASAISVVASSIGFRMLFHHEERMYTELIERAVTSLLKHSDQFFASRKIGALAGDADKFGRSIISFLDIIFLKMSGLAVNIIFSLIIITVMSPALLLPLLLVTALVVWRSFVATMRRGPFRAKRKKLTSQLNGTIADILGNQQIVRYFATEDRETARASTARSEIETIARQEVQAMELESQTRQIILFVFQILTVGASIWLFIHGHVSIAALIFAVTYLGRLTSSLFEIGMILRILEQVAIDAAPMLEILAIKPDVVDEVDAKKLNATRGAISIRNANFSYDGTQSETVINSLSLEIKAGQRVGLAGHSGGGKTTLTKLLLRFADLDSGSISIDKQNIAHVTQQSLRQSIAYVPQEPLMFHRTLRENISYGKPDASDEEILRAAKQAHAHEFIKDLPEGLDTMVGERGIKLSGGQRQRIAIARAILKDAPILVLDEATSALDSESERLIQDALEKLMKGRTSIVIAHRLSTIAKLDRIIVLEKGRVIEDGTHESLLKKKGTYAKLWSHQSGGFIEE